MLRKSPEFSYRERVSAELLEMRRQGMFVPETAITSSHHPEVNEYEKNGMSVRDCADLLIQLQVCKNSF